MRTNRSKAPLSLLSPASKPFEIFLIDSMDFFKDGQSMKKYIHLLTDHFTRHAWIVTVKSQMANNFISLTNKVKEIKLIEALRMDQYSGINVNEFERHSKLNNIRVIFTVADCAFSNRLIDIAN